MGGVTTGASPRVLPGPYQERDHGPNIALELPADDRGLDHLEVRSDDEADLHAFGARHPQPAAAGRPSAAVSEALAGHHRGVGR